MKFWQSRRRESICQSEPTRRECQNEILAEPEVRITAARIVMIKSEPTLRTENSLLSSITRANFQADYSH